MKSGFLAGALVTSHFYNVAGFANPLPCMGVCNNTQDPSVIQRGSDGTWFRFSTASRVAIHSAPTEFGPWEYEGTAIPQGFPFDLLNLFDGWSPDVSKVGDTYYLYYSVSLSNTRYSEVRLATSKDLDAGTWVDLGAMGVMSGPGSNYNAIDATLHTDIRNRHWLTFGSFWDNIFNVELPDPPTTYSNAPLNHLVMNKTESHAIEGAYLFPWEDYYYLFFSSGICCDYDITFPSPGSEYKIMVCRSEDANGPFVDASGTSCLDSGGTLVLKSHGFVYGPGGQSVYLIPGIGPVIYYHYADTRVGYGTYEKLLGMNFLNFSTGWPVV
jgi:arabinan endo-1,5-alpha-L-arabinosidase